MDVFENRKMCTSVRKTILARQFLLSGLVTKLTDRNNYWVGCGDADRSEDW